MSARNGLRLALGILLLPLFLVAFVPTAMLVALVVFVLDGHNILHELWEDIRNWFSDCCD